MKTDYTCYALPIFSLPHIESLRNKDLIWFLENKCDDALNCLPDDCKMRSINQQRLWILCITKFINHSLGNTFNTEAFEEMISEAIKERQDKYIEKHWLMIDADPRIVEVFQNSSFVSRKIYIKLNYCFKRKKSNVNQKKIYLNLMKVE